MSDNSSDFGSFLAGFVIGGLVGAATALILAPQSGEETRSQISTRSHDLVEQGEQRMHHYQEVINEQTTDYRDRASHMFSAHEDDEAELMEDEPRIVLDSGVSEDSSDVVEDEPAAEDAAADKA